MALKELSKSQFTRLCPAVELPRQVVPERWYATEDHQFAAIIVRHTSDTSWEYLVYRPGRPHLAEPIVSANSFRAPPEHELRGKLQELLLREAAQ